jgi:hypothetical protein
MDCNNEGPKGCDPKSAMDAVVVRWSGTELTVDEPESGPTGKPTTSRISWSDIKPDSFTEVGSLEVTPGKFATVMVIHAVRAAQR